MADRQILIGQSVGGIIVHQQNAWATGVDRLVDPDSRQLALTSEVVAAATGIQGAVDTYAELPDPATLDIGALYVVRQDAGAPSGNGLYRVNESNQWAFLDGLNLQNAGEVAYSNTTSGLSATTAQGAIDELAADLSALGTPAANTVTFDNTNSGLTATDVQAAIDELQGQIAATTPSELIAGDGLAVSGSTWSVDVDDATIGFAPGVVTVAIADATTPTEANGQYTNTSLDFNDKSIWVNPDSRYIHSAKISALTKRWLLTDYAPVPLSARNYVEVIDNGDFGSNATSMNPAGIYLPRGTHNGQPQYWAGSSYYIRYDGTRWFMQDDGFGGPIYQAQTPGVNGLGGTWELAPGSPWANPPTVNTTGATTLSSGAAYWPDRIYWPDESGVIFGAVVMEKIGVRAGRWVYSKLNGLVTDQVLVWEADRWRLQDPMAGGVEWAASDNTVAADRSPVDLAFTDNSVQPCGSVVAEAHFYTADDASATDFPETGASFTAGRTGSGTPSVVATAAPGPLRIKPYVDGSSDGQGGSAWATSAPGSLKDAIDRLATQVAAHLGGTIPA